MSLGELPSLLSAAFVLSEISEVGQAMHQFILGKAGFCVQFRTCI